MVNVLVTTTMHEAAVEVLKSGRVTQRSKATANSTDDSSTKKSEKTARDAGQRGSAAGADEEEEVLVRIGDAEWSGGGEECISLSALRTLSRLAKVPLHRLLERSEIVEKAPVKPPRNPQLVARLKRLQVEQENREYKKMVGNIPGVNRDGDDERLSARSAIREAQDQMSTAFGFLFTAAAVFLSCYYAASFVYENLAARVLIGLAGALLTLFAELWFFIRNDW